MSKRLFSICKPSSRIRRAFSDEATAERVLARMVCEQKGIQPIRADDINKVSAWEMRRVRIGKTSYEKGFRRAA